MAEIQKIYRGMQNGAETIDKNFAELTQRIGAVTNDDLDWVEAPLDGFNKSSKLRYCIHNSVLYISFYGAPSEAYPQGSGRFWNIPPKIAARLPQFNIDRTFTDASGGSSLLAFTLQVRAKANAIDLYASGEVSTSRRLAIWEVFPLTTKL